MNKFVKYVYSLVLLELVVLLFAYFVVQKPALQSCDGLGCWALGLVLPLFAVFAIAIWAVYIILDIGIRSLRGEAAVSEPRKWHSAFVVLNGLLLLIPIIVVILGFIIIMITDFELPSTILDRSIFGILLITGGVLNFIVAGLYDKNVGVRKYVVASMILSFVYVVYGISLLAYKPQF